MENFRWETGEEGGYMYETRRLNILMLDAFKIRRELFIHVWETLRICVMDFPHFLLRINVLLNNIRRAIELNEIIKFKSFNFSFRYFFHLN